MSAQQPVLTRRQVQQVDALAINKLKIPSIILMENAGRNAAEWIHRHFGADERTARILCGAGNNGGDGLVVARHLVNAGWSVAVDLVGDLDRLTQNTAINYAVIDAMGVPITVHTDSQEFHRIGHEVTPDTILIDALLGTGFTGDVREPIAELIRWMAQVEARATIAIDVPSGLDCDAGTIGNVAMSADATVTFVAMKTGFTHPQAGTCLGEIVVADIGAPPQLIEWVQQAPVE